MIKFDKWLAILTAISCALFWLALSLGTKSLFPGAMYWTIVIGGLGGFIYWKKDAITQYLQSIRLPSFFKFILLGYGVVLLEEILAAFTNNLTEGFSFSLYIVRIGQFWAFNILAFTGFIIGWYFLYRYLRYTRREMFFLAGGWGLYAEHVIPGIFGNPIGYTLLILPTIMTYGIMITPSMLSMEKTGEKVVHPILKYILTYAVIFVCSIIPMAILLWLRGLHPELFPPTNFIQ